MHSELALGIKNHFDFLDHGEWFLWCSLADGWVVHRCCSEQNEGKFFL